MSTFFGGKHADIAEKSKNAYVPAHSFAGLYSPGKAVQLKEVFRQRPRVKAYAFLPCPSQGSCGKVSLALLTKKVP